MNDLVGMGQLRKERSSKDFRGIYIGQDTISLMEHVHRNVRPGVIDIGVFALVIGHC